MVIATLATLRKRATPVPFVRGYATAATTTRRGGGWGAFRHTRPQFGNLLRRKFSAARQTQASLANLPCSLRNPTNTHGGAVAPAMGVFACSAEFQLRYPAWARSALGEPLEPHRLHPLNPTSNRHPSPRRSHGGDWRRSLGALREDRRRPVPSPCEARRHALRWLALQRSGGSRRGNGRGRLGRRHAPPRGPTRRRPQSRSLRRAPCQTQSPTGSPHW